MASKNLIQDMLTHLCTVWTSREITDDLIQTYYLSLKRFSDDEVREAGFKYIDQAEGKAPFPKPGDISLRISNTNLPTNEDFIIRSDVRCQTCGHIGEGIQEPKGTSFQCRECYTGLTPQEIKSRFTDLFRMMGDKDYKPEWVK